MVGDYCLYLTGPNNVAYRIFIITKLLIIEWLPSLLCYSVTKHNQPVKCKVVSIKEVLMPLGEVILSAITYLTFRYIVVKSALFLMGEIIILQL